MVLLSCVPAFCATEKTEEKKPVAALAFGCVNVPPGVFASSTVGDRGEFREPDSLLGRVADCARLCRMLSTELRLFFGETEPLAKVLKSACESVGVGGVMNVVGVLRRLGGVMVENGFERRDRGVSGLVGTELEAMVSFGGINGGTSPNAGIGSVLTLFLLLEVLNNPANPPPPLPDDLTDSSPPADFLRGRMKASLSGEGLRPDVTGEGRGSRGSTI